MLPSDQESQKYHVLMSQATLPPQSIRQSVQLTTSHSLLCREKEDKGKSEYLE